MAPTRFVLPSVLALALASSFCGLAAAETSAAKPAPKAAAKPVRKPAAKPAEFVLPAAGAEQVAAAGRVYYGAYECEFNQKIDIVADSRHPAYVGVRHLKAAYLMKPVVSSTGAVRLEDIRGETLMVQIANKSMLLNVKTGQRVVDDCVSPAQRELIAAAKLAREALGGDAAASPSMLSGAASVPSGAAPAPLGAASAPSGAASAPSDAASAPSDAASAATR